MTFCLRASTIILLLASTFLCDANASTQNPGQLTQHIDLEAAARSKSVRSTQLSLRLEEIYVEHNELALRQIEAESRHRVWTLWYQHLASWLILGLVIAIVATGLRMSWRQLTADLAAPKGSLAQSTSATTSPAAPEVSPPLTCETTSRFSVSATGISFSSPVIGLIVFLASIAFFYIYIMQVFPISAIGEHQPRQETAQSPLGNAETPQH